MTIIAVSGFRRIRSLYGMLIIMMLGLCPATYLDAEDDWLTELTELTTAYRGVLVSADSVTTTSVEKWDACQCRVVLFVTDAGRPESRAAELIQERLGTVEYFFEVGRCPPLADRHPQWMASLQGHDAWRRLFPGFPEPATGQTVKCYPWVPVFHQEASAAHRDRIRSALARLPKAERIWLNDIQGGPSACGCGHILCRWTANYGPVKTAIDRGDSAPSQFVQSISQLSPGSEIIPVMTSECEQEDQHADCGGVNCFRGQCWKSFSRQLDQVAKVAPRIGVACYFREFGRDLKRYGDTAEWTRKALESFEQMPPQRGGLGVKPKRLMAVVQGWNVEPVDIANQVKFASKAGVSGILVSMVDLEQSWTPRMVSIAGQSGTADK